MLKLNPIYKAAVGVLLFGSVTYGSIASDDVVERGRIAGEALEIVMAHENTTNLSTLAQLKGKIDTVWYEFTKAFGTDNPTAAKLSVLKARAALTAEPTRKKTNVANNWKKAIRALPTNTTQLTRLTYFTRAAGASAKAKDYRSAKEFFAAARTLATARGDGETRARLYLRIEELRSTGQGTEWRRLNDSLLDLRKYSNNFVMWTVPRLDALIGEAEIRFTMQPNSEEKRKELGRLKADIVLLQKSMDTAIPPGHTDRIRTLFYALEDHFDL